MNVVLDASALLAFLKDEPGAEMVESLLGKASLSSVNWAEVMQKCLARGVDTRGMREDIEALGVSIEPFNVDQGELAGSLWLKTRELGLSLGDRACLALGIMTGRDVVTTDKAWGTLDLGVVVRLIR